MTRANRSYFKGIFAAALLSTPLAIGAIVVDDAFEDGGADNGRDPHDIAWSYSGGAENLDVVTEAESKALRATDVSERDEYLVSAIFPEQTLEVGQTLRLTVVWRQGQAPRDGLSRYGVGLLTHGSVWGGDGYAVLFNLGGVAEKPHVRFLKETNTQVINWNGEDVILEPSEQTLEPHVGTEPFVIQFEITRSDVDLVKLSFTLQQGEQVYSCTAVDSAAILNGFQRVAIRTDQKDGEKGGTTFFRRITVERLP